MCLRCIRVSVQSQVTGLLEKSPKLLFIVSLQGTGAAIKIKAQNIAGQLLAPRVNVQQHCTASLYAIFLKVTVCVDNERLPLPLMTLCMCSSNVH